MANPPLNIGPFTTVPAPGSPIKSDWPQQVTQYFSDAVRVYATQSAMTADPRPPANGAQAITLDTYTRWTRRGSAWEPSPRLLDYKPISGAGNYFGVADVAGTAIVWTGAAGHYYQVEAFVTLINNATGANGCTMQITDGANTVLATAGASIPTQNYQACLTAFNVVALAGATTVKVRLSSTVSPGVSIFSAGSLIVTDIGPR